MRHLAVIAQLSEVGTLSATAKSLELSQPAVSKALAYAETQLGFELFVRTSRGATATKRGQAMVRYAKLIIGNLERAAIELERPGDKIDLTIGMPCGDLADHPSPDPRGHRVREVPRDVEWARALRGSSCPGLAGHRGAVRRDRMAGCRRPRRGRGAVG